FRVNHGSIDSLGFRIGDLAYLPDVAEIYDDAWEELTGLDCFIVDALRRTPHPTHAHLDRALEWIEQVAPRRAVLTNMHIDLDYATVEAETAEHITPAHDGMVIRYAL
ncbi:MBL fold metallo-hydrolase, partial [Cribrihabitans sp. XS_ASV171]